MKRFGGRRYHMLRQGALIGLLWGGLLTPVLADGVITVEPALVGPDENGVVRFSIVAAGIVLRPSTVPPVMVNTSVPEPAPSR